jgi:predicted amidophosphoribosyltransferase
VPGAPARIRARGFDQAGLIADVFRDACVPWARPLDVLIRHDSPQAQVALKPGPLRAANVSGAFSIRPNAIVPPSILLVDDVFTTGSTMHEAARVLRAAGAHEVFGFALAVGK